MNDDSAISDQRLKAGLRRALSSNETKDLGAFVGIVAPSDLEDLHLIGRSDFYGFRAIGVLRDQALWGHPHPEL